MRQRPPSPAARARLSRRALLRAGLLGGAGLATALTLGCGDGEETGERIEVRRRRDPGDGSPVGRLRLGLPGQPDDPPPAGLVAATLIAMDPRTGRIYGDLARSVEWRPDELTLALRMRPEPRFHPDGEGTLARVDAEAVRLDLERRASAQEFLPAQVIAQIEAPDADTLLLRLAGPFCVLFEYLANASHAGVWRLDAEGTPVLGSGPFVPAGGGVEGQQLTAHTAYHHNDYPRLRAVVVRHAASDAELAAAWDEGMLDARMLPAGSVVPADDPTPRQLRASRGVRSLGLSLLPAVGGDEAGTQSPFLDARVRLALARALDRDALATVDGATLAGPVGPAHGLDRLAEEQLREHDAYRTDPAEARALLEAAGAADLAFALDVPNRGAMREVARMLEAQLREVGLQPQLRLLPEEDFPRAFEAGGLEAALFDAPPYETPDLDLRQHMTGGVSGEASPWGYSNPVYDAAARLALEAVLPAERAERSREAQRLLLDDVPALLPLVAPPEHMLLRDDVVGFEFDAYGHNESWISAAWSIEARPEGERPGG